LPGVSPCIDHPKRRPRGGRQRWCAHGAIVVFALAAAPYARAADELMFDQALLVAQQRSRLLPSQEAAASAARDMAIAAGRLPDPTLKAGINNLPINGPDAFSLTNDFMTMRSIGVMQEFTRGDKRKARTARFEREAEMAEVTRAAALANLQRDAASAWLDRYYQERMRDLQVSQRDEARLQMHVDVVAGNSARG
jgi:outer membrane protein TolC